MDMDSLKRDLRHAISVLPTDLLEMIPILIAKAIPHFGYLKAEVPKLKALLAPHFMAGMVEASCGALDREALEIVAKELLGEILRTVHGVPVPNPDDEGPETRDPTV